MTDESMFRKKQREECRSCTVWLSCDLIAAIDEHAEQTDMSATEIIETALEEYLDVESECE
jgi:predicted transcriptional regulator